MLKEYWYIAAESRELTVKKPLGRKLLGQRLVLWRDRAGVAHAIDDICIHRSVPLSLGEVNGDCIRCPFHGWAFNGEGYCTLIPSNGPDVAVPSNARTRAYPIQEQGDYIWIYTGSVSSAKDCPIYVPTELSSGDWAVGRRYDDVATNYTRVNEQNIDVAHLPWVHRKTIGRSMSRDARIDRPMAPREDGLSLYFNDTMPDWLEALRRPFEKLDLNFKSVKQPMLLPDGLHFDMPNLFRIVKGGIIAGLYAVPLDEGHTRIYHYVARRWLKHMPLLSKILVRINLRIIREDMRIFRVQELKRMPEEVYKEFQVRADEAQIYYRKLRSAYFDLHPAERAAAVEHQSVCSARLLKCDEDVRFSPVQSESVLSD